MSVHVPSPEFMPPHVPRSSEYKMRKELRYLLFLFGIIFLIGFASASVTCSPSKLVLNKTQNTMPIMCDNTGNNSVTLTSSSSGISLSTGIVPAKSNQTIYVSMHSTTLPGIYYILNSNTLVSSVSVPQTTQSSTSSGCKLVQLPYTSTYLIKQGDVGSGTEIDVVASGCPALTFGKVSSQTGGSFTTIANQGNIINSNNQVTGYSFTVGWNAQGISTGTYTNTYTVSATDNQSNVYSLPVPISFIVSAGVSPITNFSLSDLPTCSLDKNQVALNSSLTLTCTNLINNIQINVPQYDFLQGGLPEITSTQETWKFIPQKTGNYNLSIYYTYQGLQVGSTVNLPFRVTLTGTAQAGTAIKPQFYPSLSQLSSGQTVIIQAVDNKTDSLLPNAKFYLNGQEFNGSTKLEAGVNYTLRISDVEDGYQDYVDNNLSINPKYINITLPNNIIAGKNIVVNVTPSNSTLYIDGVRLGSDNFTAVSGNHTLEAVASGYIDTYKNFTVTSAISVTSSSLWQRGTLFTFTLSKPTSYTINYAKPLSSSFTQIGSGNNNTGSFTPNSPGTYEILDSNGNQIYSNQIQAGQATWYYWAGGVVGVILIILIIIALTKRPKRSSGGYDPSGGYDDEDLGGVEGLDEMQ